MNTEVYDTRESMIKDILIKCWNQSSTHDELNDQTKICETILKNATDWNVWMSCSVALRYILNTNEEDTQQMINDLTESLTSNLNTTRSNDITLQHEFANKMLIATEHLELHTKQNIEIETLHHIIKILTEEIEQIQHQIQKTQDSLLD